MQPLILTYDPGELVVKKQAWINLILGFPALCLFVMAMFSDKETKTFSTGIQL
jgi:hypothetical protein